MSEKVYMDSTNLTRVLGKIKSLFDALYATRSVSIGGTGKTSFTSGRLLEGNGTNAIAEREITTSVGTDTTSTKIPTEGAIAAKAADLDAIMQWARS